MKIALCLHGLLDSTTDNTSKGTDGYHHIYNNILKHNDVDIYIHSWEVGKEDQIKNMYGNWIVDIQVEQQIDFKPHIQANQISNYCPHRPTYEFWKTFSHFYSIAQCFKLVPDNKKYDIVIKSRFDLGRINRNTSGPHNPQNPYAVQCINFDPTLDMSYLYMAKYQDHYYEREGPPDMWFYSNQENMSNFKNLFNIIERDVRVGSEFEMWAGKSDGGIQNAIKMWKWFFISTGLWGKRKLLESKWE